MNRTVMISVGILIAALASIALMLAANRPGPEDAVAEGDAAVAEVAAEQPAAEVAQTDGGGRVAFDIDVAGTTIRLQPINSEQIDLVDAPIQPVVEQQPADPQPVENQEPTTVGEVVADPAPTQVPAQEPTQAPAPEPTPVPDVQPGAAAQINTAVEPIITIPYRVVAEDTLFRLTVKHITSIELMARYGISSDDMVLDSDLTLPVANPQYCINSNPYIVREKETAFSISRWFGIELETLRAINNLDAEYRLLVTQVLCIP